jgi:predicted nucleic acid-binding Zn ribbon protein
MDIDDQFELEHLFLTERKCRVCGKIKDLIDGFYLTRKNKGALPSSYSYECKECTIKRVVTSRMTTKVFDKWEYPDW